MSYVSCLQVGKEVFFLVYLEFGLWRLGKDATAPHFLCSLIVIKGENNQRRKWQPYFLFNIHLIYIFLFILQAYRSNINIKKQCLLFTLISFFSIQPHLLFLFSVYFKEQCLLFINVYIIRINSNYLWITYHLIGMEKYLTKRKLTDSSETSNADFSKHSRVEINLEDLP